MESLYDIVFIHLGNDSIYEMNCNKYFNTSIFMNKPDFGFWASRYTPDAQYKSSWDRFNSKNNIKNYNNKEVLFKVKKDSPVLVLSDLEKLDSKYINLDTFKEKKELESKLMEMQPSDDKFMDILYEYNTFSLRCRSHILNWMFILEDFKGVYLTEEALCGQFSDAFNLWDVESIVIFDTSIIELYVKE